MSQVVKVEVQEVRHSGVFVKILGDDRRGFIRSREISWDRRIGFIPRMPQSGERLDAIILEEDEEQELVYFSLRNLTDPWENLFGNPRYQVGKTVTGEVVNLRPLRAYIQLEPGIDAIVRSKDVPLLEDKKIEGILWIGDRVCGIISQIDLDNREIKLNLCQVFRLLATTENRQQIQLDLLKAESKPVQVPQTLEIPPPSDSTPGIIRRFRAGIPRPKRFLVVDDEENALTDICTLLKNTYAVEADGVKSGKEAANKIKEGQPYGLALIDIRLSGEYGTEVAERIRALKADLPVLYMSTAALSSREQPNATFEAPLIEKDLYTIAEWVDKLCNGYWIERQKPDSLIDVSNGHFIRQLEIIALARQNLKERLSGILQNLITYTQVNLALVIELDSANRTASVLASEPPLSPNILEESLSNLYYSPVQNVVEDEIEFRKNNIRRGDTRFKNLFPSILYSSCFGLPVLIPDHVTKQALFLFDKRAWAFSSKQGQIRKLVRQARLAVSFIAIAIERASMLEAMRRYQDIYFRGSLLDDMVHELNNKLQGLGSQTARLQSVLPDQLDLSETVKQSDWLTIAKDAASKISRDEEKITGLVKAYQRLVKQDWEPVNISEIVYGAIRQLEYTANEAGIEIIPDLDAGLPLARAIQAHLEQALVNIILNAIQQIGLYRTRMKNTVHEQGEQYTLSQHDFIIIQTRYQGKEAVHPIVINIIDTGPGVHWQLQERIFSRGYSNRKGAGLGLSISRDLIEMMGGQLSLCASLMFIGSAFSVKLPANGGVEGKR